MEQTITSKCRTLIKRDSFCATNRPFRLSLHEHAPFGHKVGGFLHLILPYNIYVCRALLVAFRISLPDPAKKCYVTDHKQYSFAALLDGWLYQPILFVVFSLLVLPIHQQRTERGGVHLNSRHHEITIRL